MQIYLPIAEMPMNVLLLLALGAAVGFVSGMFGVGGGFLLTPFLIFMGIPTAVAVASASAQIAASSVSGALTYWRRKAVDPRMGLVLIAGGLVGTLLGILFFNAMRRFGQLDLVISLSYVTLLLGIGGMMFIESAKALIARGKGSPPSRRQAHQHRWYEALPFKMRFVQSKLYISALPILSMGVVFGFIGAVLGIGGGFMLVPALIYIFRVPAAVVVGTSQFQILSTMLIATVLHAIASGTVDLVLALILIVGGVFGAQMGVRAGQKLKGEQFRLLLAALILVVGARFAGDLLLRPEEPYSIAPGEVRR